jgi:hypothetical protein
VETQESRLASSVAYFRDTLSAILLLLGGLADPLAAKVELIVGSKESNCPRGTTSRYASGTSARCRRYPNQYYFNPDYRDLNGVLEWLSDLVRSDLTILSPA